MIAKVSPAIQSNFLRNSGTINNTYKQNSNNKTTNMPDNNYNYRGVFGKQPTSFAGAKIKNLPPIGLRKRFYELETIASQKSNIKSNIKGMFSVDPLYQQIEKINARLDKDLPQITPDKYTIQIPNLKDYIMSDRDLKTYDIIPHHNSFGGLIKLPNGSTRYCSFSRERTLYSYGQYDKNMNLEAVAEFDLSTGKLSELRIGDNLNIRMKKNGKEAEAISLTTNKMLYEYYPDGTLNYASTMPNKNGIYTKLEYSNKTPGKLEAVTYIDNATRNPVKKKQEIRKNIMLRTELS